MNKNNFIKTFLVFGFCILVYCSFAQNHVNQFRKPELTLINNYPEPVITNKSKGAEDIKYGYEGGTVVKVDENYHLFTSEMSGDPLWVKMRLGHWKSTDRIHWQRVSTIRESSGEFEGKDPRASLWSPMVFFDSTENKWDLFYVAYHAEPNLNGVFRWNEKGRIYRSVSETNGRNGIAGPYKDIVVILKPEKNSDPWEGLQGTDSFYPWKVGDTYYAFYGSVRNEKWLVGMTTAKKLQGPWKRMTDRNPSNIESKFIENPVVSRLSNGTFICVYDNNMPDAIGWAFSSDGINWSPGQSLQIQPQAGKWSKEIRTPLGLVDEGNNRFTVFYTGFEQSVDWGKLLNGETEGMSCAIGFVEIKISF